jgi:hypothetical protein
MLNLHCSEGVDNDSGLHVNGHEFSLFRWGSFEIAVAVSSFISISLACSSMTEVGAGGVHISGSDSDTAILFISCTMKL